MGWGVENGLCRKEKKTGSWVEKKNKSKSSKRHSTFYRTEPSRGGASVFTFFSVFFSRSEMTSCPKSRYIFRSVCGYRRIMGAPWNPLEVPGAGTKS